MYHQTSDKMSSVTLHTKENALALIKRETVRSDLTVQEAIKSVARKARLSPGTIFNLVNDRLKKLSFEVFEKINALALSEINSEIQRLEHERQILLQSGSVSFAVEIQEVDALLAKAKELMRGAK
jgi:hypothetical protein